MRASKKFLVWALVGVYMRHTASQMCMMSHTYLKMMHVIPCTDHARCVMFMLMVATTAIAHAKRAAYIRVSSRSLRGLIVGLIRACLWVAFRKAIVELQGASLLG